MLIGCCALGALAAEPPKDEARVAEAARELLLQQAEREGWREPQVSLDVRAAGSGAAARCAQPEVRAAETTNPTRMRFELRCADGSTRAFMVRARLSAEVPVAAAALPAGRVLAEDDVVLQRHAVAGSPPPLAAAEDAVGRVARRSIGAGQMLTARLLDEPLLVRRGEAVQIRARRDAVEVVVPGQALEAGRRGQTIRVRNTGNGTVIRARVVEAGQVEPESMLSSPR
ncbi:flagella basal body P-ring formation protein FlgA [Rubrivivax gelatinosus]|uniref:Flagella basal body P-ring formation protein FlgA n=1 Tax=Rubrivivax gelatinosus TaxID=28068 RepID=A0A4R2MV42_RUBGE|nr:flagellar basal body P-ring formation chaperone FlgA [Rubrivivax gelatinosus]TCP03523.1 flagella basal body P-ring formation protein FlgA [Rubrivivax gelatinosus]